jgi:hypothetical protein
MCCRRDAYARRGNAMLMAGADARLLDREPPPAKVSLALGLTFVSAFLRVISAAAAEYGFEWRG